MTLLVASVLEPVDQNGTEGMGRQVSYGSVWSVGGVAPGGTAVDNGRGQLIQSGTNARLFRTCFATIKPKPEEEMSKHEDRLAAALGLDRAHKVLDVNTLLYQSDDPQKRPRSVLTQWNGIQWVNTGSPLSRLGRDVISRQGLAADVARTEEADREQISPRCSIQVSRCNALCLVTRRRRFNTHLPGSSMPRVYGMTFTAPSSPTHPPSRPWPSGSAICCTSGPRTAESGC